MKKMKIFAWTILLAAGLTACTDWLTVQPKTEVSKDDMFKSSGGFRDALIGVYTLMRENNYAPNGNLVTGMVEFIANLWYTESNSESGDFAAHNYRGDAVERANGELFLQQYKTITNLNQMLAYMENGVLSSREYALYKGEALGLRAYLHFDLIRLYGPMPMNVQEGRRYLPYETTISLGNYTYSTYNEYMGALIADLDSAEILLARVDPIITTSNSVLNTTNEYRQNRMNYYAVLALKARVYLYAGEQARALDVAKKLLTDPKVNEYFPAVDPTKLLANQRNPDRVFSTEVLAGIYKKDRVAVYNSYFSSSSAGNNYLHPRKDFVSTSLFASETQDYRFQTWWQVSSGVGETGHMLIKYKDIDKPSGETDSEYFYAIFMSLIRLSEVYYIAAECEPVLEDKYGWLNEIRGRRGLPVSPVISEEDFMTRLRVEYLREFLGEGQIFFLYKRLFGNIIPSENGYDLNTYEAKEENYVLPMPSGEIENR